MMPAPLGAWWSPWEASLWQVGVCGSQAPTKSWPPLYLLKVLVIKGYLGRPRLPHPRAVVGGFLISWRRDGGEPVWGAWGM